MTEEKLYRVNSEELLNRSFRYYYTVDTSAFSNDDFDLFVNSLENSCRNSTKKYKKNAAPLRPRMPRACSKKLVDYPDSEIYENVSSGISYMEIVDESPRPMNFSGASSVLLDVSSSYECLSSIPSSPQHVTVDKLTPLRASTEGLLQKNKSLKDIFSYFDEDVKINDSSTTSLHRIGRRRPRKTSDTTDDEDSFLTYDEEKYDNKVYLYKKQQKSVDNMVNEFQRLKSSYLQQTLNDYNATRNTSTATVGRLAKNRIQFFENMCASGDGIPNNTTYEVPNKLNNTQKSFNQTKAIFEENERNLSKTSITPLCKILPIGKALIKAKSLEIENSSLKFQNLKEKSLLSFDSSNIVTPQAIPVFNVNLHDNFKEKSFSKEAFFASKFIETSLNSTPITPVKASNAKIMLNHSSPITPPQPEINWETHPEIKKRQSVEHATQTTPKKYQDHQTNTSPMTSPIIQASTPAKCEVSGKNLSFTLYEASEQDDDTEIAFVDNYSCFTFDDAPFININDKSLMLALENFLAIWDLSLIDMILALINENCNLTVQTEVIVKTNMDSVDKTSLDLQLCHMSALAYETNEVGAVMKLSLFDPATNGDKDVKIVFCAIGDDQISLVDEKLSVVTDNILIYIAFILKPPENELQKSHETNTNLSEHQLRVQASLQRLNVPDWYKSYTSGNNTTIGASPANRSTLDSSGFLRKRNSDVGRWTGLSSKTTSLSSLGSQRSDRSPVMLSPSSHSHHGQTGFSRWSTSHLNSNQTSPSVSTRGSFSRGVLSAGGYQSTGNTLRGSYRQPYLGWRSQEKLAAQQQQQQQQASTLRTPAERLASSLLQQKQQQQQRDSDSKPPIPPHHQHHYQQQSASPVIGTPEIKDEIKEVTSAIVHYVNDQRNSRSRSTSPSQRCWLESSFVGTKPLESPQTPVIDNATTTNVVAAFQSSSLTRHSTSSRNNGAALNGNGESTYV